MIETTTAALIGVAAVSLTAAAVIGVMKIVRGPSALDRVVASDLMVAVVIGAIGLWTVVSGKADLLLVPLVLSLVGYTGAASVARLVGEKLALARKAEPADEEGAL